MQNEVGVQGSFIDIHSRSTIVFTSHRYWQNILGEATDGGENGHFMVLTS